MRAIYYAAFIFILSVAASNIAGAQAFSPPSSITVTGEAMAKVVPDQVTLPITIYAEDKELNAAKDASDKKLKAVLAIAKKLSIADNKLQTQSTQIAPQYDYADGKQTLRNYMASSTIVVTLIDTSKLTPLMQDLTEAGIDRIGSAQFGIADEKKVRDELLGKAVQDARAKAYAMAGALDVKIGKALMASENGAMMPPPMPVPMVARAEMAFSKAPPAPDLPGGQIEIRQSVTASFAIE